MVLQHDLVYIRALLVRGGYHEPDQLQNVMLFRVQRRLDLAVEFFIENFERLVDQLYLLQFPTLFVNFFALLIDLPRNNEKG